MRPKDTTLTPLWLIDSLGPFDLDPCGFPEHPTASRLIVLPQCGLAEPWSGRVWLNPPYSDTAPWLEKLAAHGSGTALVLASTDTAWYHDHVAAKASAVLFMRGRPRFLRPNKSEVGLMRASLLVAYGSIDALILQCSGILGHFVDLQAQTADRS